MKISRAEFTKGVIGDDYSTKDGLPHIAFFGRSNAGKSSVINSLANQKNLVRVSKVPGKTLEANFFRINHSFYLIDFPGYGYAKHSISDRNKLVKRIFWYIEHSSARPRAVCLITDAKVGLTVLDREMIKILKENRHPVIIVANKIDKLNKAAAKKQLSLIQKEMEGMSVLGYSAKTNEGRDELIQKITEFI